ncbi:hypothetical protein [Pseudothauera hydrothermalis]|uniref:hypothetical protein n=1 Tax=Pseudothauera hydrothermalis TaxID=2184083 RepID=UPI000E08F708|nr:hypothetical protein [Pseudothauera hydrothermalis]
MAAIVKALANAASIYWQNEAAAQTARARLHEAATGQRFEPAIYPELWADTEGQPWLVNALGHELTWNMRARCVIAAVRSRVPWEAKIWQHSETRESRLVGVWGA